jgi:hypothetical protein
MADDVEGSGPVTYDLEQGAEWRFELQEPDEAIAIRVSLDGLPTSVYCTLLSQESSETSM